MVAPAVLRLPERATDPGHVCGPVRRALPGRRGIAEPYAGASVGGVVVLSVVLVEVSAGVLGVSAGVGVGSGLGTGVGSGIGSGVGVGSGVTTGVGSGVGVGSGATTGVGVGSGVTTAGLGEGVGVGVAEPFEFEVSVDDAAKPDCVAELDALDTPTNGWQRMLVGTSGRALLFLNEHVLTAETQLVPAYAVIV
jgi:hypothetical protein